MINITEKQVCSGCHACINICPQKCITMESDNEGFWYPTVKPDECINCNKCVKVCLVSHEQKIDPPPRAYACYNSNELIRIESSSGGIFPLIASQILNSGGVVFGAGFNKDHLVVHSYGENVKDLRDFQGSKYVQSGIGATYNQAKQFLERDRQVLFSGTPCQIAGLKAFLQHYYSKLLCLDNICHGVPSPKLLKKYILYREGLAGAPARQISFRNKDEGWRRYSVSFSFSNNVEYVQTFDKDLYMQAFLHNICLRPSCYSCNFKTLSRKSDITLGDFWGIENVVPEMDDDKGVSLIFINSSQGQETFERIKNNIVSTEVDINKAVSYNVLAVKSVSINPKREGFFKNMDRLPFDKLIKRNCSSSKVTAIIRKARVRIGIALAKIGFTEGK